MTDTENPLGTDGFEFVEYAAADPALLDGLFRKLGFKPVAKHNSRDITIYRQGQINFLLNAEEEGFAADFHNAHGPCACSMAFRVKDADFAFAEALKRGAHRASDDSGSFVVETPAIDGIGGSRLYLVDRYGEQSIYDDYDFMAGGEEAEGFADLTYIDHLTHNVNRGNLDKWADFYARIFNFNQIRYFDITGDMTGLVSRAMGSPCGKICIPINESKDDLSQIAEYLDEYKGEGIQHVALGTDNIYDSVAKLKSNGIAFQDTPDTYFELLSERIPDHGEDMEGLKKYGILMDGQRNEEVGLLLQIFTGNVIGPIFFEIIQRKGNTGFGEGNFNALFKSIELDQLRRGVLDSA